MNSATILASALLEDSYSYSSTQINLPENLADLLQKWGKANIPDKHLYFDEDGGCGREDESHVTVKYGLMAKEPPKALLEIAEQTAPFKAVLGNISLFENEKYDVVKVDLESEGLVQLNHAITAQCDCKKDDFKDYHPHATVAYVKKGTCADLVGADIFQATKDVDREFEVEEMLFSAKGSDEDGDRLRVILHFDRLKKESLSESSLPRGFRFKPELDNGNIAVVTQKGTHVASLWWKPLGSRTVMLELLTVDRAFRGRGIGTALVQEFKRLLPSLFPDARVVAGDATSQGVVRLLRRVFGAERDVSAAAKLPKRSPSDWLTTHRTALVRFTLPGRQQEDESPKQFLNRHTKTVQQLVDDIWERGWVVKRQVWDRGLLYVVARKPAYVPAVCAIQALERAYGKEFVGTTQPLDRAYRSHEVNEWITLRFKPTGMKIRNALAQQQEGETPKEFLKRRGPSLLPKVYVLRAWTDQFHHPRNVSSAQLRLLKDRDWILPSYDSEWVNGVRVDTLACYRVRPGVPWHSVMAYLNMNPGGTARVGESLPRAKGESPKEFLKRHGKALNAKKYTLRASPELGRFHHPVKISWQEALKLRELGWIRAVFLRGGTRRLFSDIEEFRVNTGVSWNAVVAFLGNRQPEDVIVDRPAPVAEGETPKEFLNRHKKELEPRQAMLYPYEEEGPPIRITTFEARQLGAEGYIESIDLEVYQVLGCYEWDEVKARLDDMRAATAAGLRLESLPFDGLDFPSDPSLVARRKREHLRGIKPGRAKELL